MITGDQIFSPAYKFQDIYSSSYSSTTLFAVMDAEFVPTYNTSDPDKILLDSLSTLRATPNAQFATSALAYFQGNRSLETLYHDQYDQYIKTTFIFWDGASHNKPSRYYALTHLYTKGFYNDEDYNRFINSFQIIE
jgi:hypothetical protein